MNSQSLLSKLILDRRYDLEKYASRPDASDWYLNKENALLKCLTEIRDGMYPLEYQIIWSIIEKEWYDVKRRDANHSGIQIQLFLTPKRRILCNLPIDLFEYGL